MRRNQALLSLFSLTLVLAISAASDVTSEKAAANPLPGMPPVLDPQGYLLGRSSPAS